MSDLGTRDVTLEAYSRINLSSNQDGRDVEADLESSEPQQNVEAIGECFKSLLNSNCRENSEITIETT